MQCRFSIGLFLKINVRKTELDIFFFLNLQILACLELFFINKCKCINQRPKRLSMSLEKSSKLEGSQFDGCLVDENPDKILL